MPLLDPDARERRVESASATEKRCAHQRPAPLSTAAASGSGGAKRSTSARISARSISRASACASGSAPSDRHEAELARRADIAQHNQVAGDDGQHAVDAPRRAHGAADSDAARHQRNDANLKSEICNLQFHDSERLSQRDVPGVQVLETAWRDFLAVDLESEVDADRSDRRLVPHAEAGRAAQAAAGRCQSACLNTFPYRRSRPRRALRITGSRSSALKMTTPLPPIGNPSSSIASGVPSWSRAKPRTVVSPPAKKRSLAGSLHAGP